MAARRASRQSRDRSPAAQTGGAAARRRSPGERLPGAGGLGRHRLGSGRLDLNVQVCTLWVDAANSCQFFVMVHQD
ncbi:hypothetical protein A33M_0481 [Rhodovulum sp. PH10]|nr:hypothetical protein A33M_0481 [Rhodovulum sp. PH10]